MHPNPHPYPAYKSSGVEWLGHIPAHWAVRRLKLSVANSTEQTNKRHEHEIYLALEHVESWTGRYSDAGPDVVFDSQVKRFRAGDVLFGKLRPYLAKVVRPDRDGVCVGEFLVLRPRDCTMLPDYLKWLLRTKPVINAINASTYGTKMPRTNWQFIGGMKQPLPPLPEQEAIARYLDYVERRIRRYIDAKQKLVGLLEELKQATIYEAVTRGLDPDVPLKPSGVEWLGHIPAHWGKARVKYLCRFKYGDSLPANARIKGDIPVFGSNGPIGTHNSANTLSPVILIGRKGSFGKVNFSDRPCFAIDTTFYVDQHSAKADIRWLYYSLYLLRLDGFSQDSAIPGLNREFAHNQYLPKPPLPEQEAIAEYLDKEITNIDTTLNNTRREIELLQEYRTVLIADVVSGKVDVREVAANLPDDADDAERRDERDPFLYAEEHAPDC